MFWKKKEIEDQTEWGSLCIKPDWSGTYSILRYGLPTEFIMARLPPPHWYEVAGGFKSQDEAMERIKFMNLEYMLLGINRLWPDIKNPR